MIATISLTDRQIQNCWLNFQHLDGTILSDMPVSGTDLVVVALLHRAQAAIVQQLLEHKPTHIDRPARWGVVHAVGLRHGGVVTHGGAGGAGAAQKILSNDSDRKACWPDVLLHSCTPLRHADRMLSADMSH